MPKPPRAAVLRLVPLPVTCSDWVRHVARVIGPGFHPDTPGVDYLKDDGERLFTDADAERYDAGMALALTVLGDRVYEIALGAITRGILHAVDAITGADVVYVHNHTPERV